jgi:hypothetical protein
MDFMHHLLDGEAKRFYRENVLSSCTNFAEATAVMLAELNSLTRQNRVCKHLQKLRLVTIVKKKNCTVTEGLEELRKIITKLARKFHGLLDRRKTRSNIFIKQLLVQIGQIVSIQFSICLSLMEFSNALRCLGCCLVARARRSRSEAN